MDIIKYYNEKKQWSVIIITVIVIVCMGLADSASAQSYPIVVTYPSQGAPNFYTGDSLPIRWSNGAPAVDIALLKGGNYFTTIAENVSASNSTNNTYYWSNVYAQPDNDYQVLVVDASKNPPYTNSYITIQNFSAEFTFYCDCPEDGNIGQ